jgi:ribonuclease HII
MQFDQQYKKFSHIFACDEVGRGPLAGPVVACALHIENHHPKEFVKCLKFLAEIGVQDSKKLSEAKRAKILHSVFGREDFKPATTYSVSTFLNMHAIIMEMDAAAIDQLNILQASLAAMRTGVETLFSRVQANNSSAICLIDGNQYFSPIDSALEIAAIVKGDSKSLLIGLASIVAKHYRDQLMSEYAKIYPVYGFEKHFGYPTKAHREALLEHGITPIHRKSYKTVKAVIEQS